MRPLFLVNSRQFYVSIIKLAIVRTNIYANSHMVWTIYSKIIKLKLNKMML